MDEMADNRYLYTAALFCHFVNAVVVVSTVQVCVAQFKKNWAYIDYNLFCTVDRLQSTS